MNVKLEAVSKVGPQGGGGAPAVDLSSIGFGGGSGSGGGESFSPLERVVAAPAYSAPITPAGTLTTKPEPDSKPLPPSSPSRFEGAGIADVKGEIGFQDFKTLAAADKTVTPSGKPVEIVKAKDPNFSKMEFVEKIDWSEVGRKAIYLGELTKPVSSSYKATSTADSEKQRGISSSTAAALNWSNAVQRSKEGGFGSSYAAKQQDAAKNAPPPPSGRVLRSGKYIEDGILPFEAPPETEAFLGKADAHNYSEVETPSLVDSKAVQHLKATVPAHVTTSEAQSAIKRGEVFLIRTSESSAVIPGLPASVADSLMKDKRSS